MEIGNKVGGFSWALNRVIPANVTLLMFVDVIAVEDQTVSLTPMLCSMLVVDMPLTKFLKQK